MFSRIHGLYAIADNTFSPQFSHQQLAEQFLQGGCRIIQLRMKAGDPKIIATQILQLKKRYTFNFIVNDHVEVAKEVGADGVHVGANDMPVAEVRKIVGPEMLIGYSSHSLDEAVVAEKAGADYVAFGAIFPTKTKGPGHPVQGLEKLRAVVKVLKVPVVAIGGIHKNNFSQVKETGAAAIAMITALTEADVITNSVRYFTDNWATGDRRGGVSPIFSEGVHPRAWQDPSLK